MKRLIQVSLVALVFLSMKVTDEPVGLKDAAKVGIINYSLSVNPESTHYIRPFVLEITNQSNKEISVKVDNGLNLIAADSQYQDFIITRELILVLKPGEKKTEFLNAMCTEHNDQAPRENAGYSTGDLAADNMRVITTYIEKNELFNTLGQEAVWTMAGDNDLRNIAGFDTLTAFKLIQLVAKQLDIDELPASPATDDYMRNFYCTHFRVRMGGEFEYKLSKERSIVIAMFDKNNIVVRELYNNPTVSEGVHTFTYEFDASYFPDDYYYIRMIEDGNIALEGKVDMPRKLYDQD